MTDYLAVNRASWDERVPAHEASPDYSVAAFAADPDFLSGVVRFDRPRLGDVAGLDGVHLQCHIGTDTVSLARLGARMTGLDFSGPALEVGRRLAASAGVDVDFHESDVYAAVDVLGPERFDLVYTGIGALCWLPSVDRWAGVVARLLRPGGRLFLREGHPVLWSLDYGRTDGLLALHYSYFEQPEPVVENDDGTYVATDVAFTHTETHSWNHGLGEIVTALLSQGLVLSALEEHDSAPWNPLRHDCEPVGDLGEFRLREHPERLPMTYTLQAVKPA